MSQMADVHQIAALKQAGFTLEDIARIRAGSNEESVLLKKEVSILVEVCQAVVAQKEEVGNMYYRTMPEVTAACIFHKGSYASLSESYETVLRYVEENGYVISGPIRENYIDGIWNKDSESEWLTEIQVPVKKGTYGTD